MRSPTTRWGRLLAVLLALVLVAAACGGRDDEEGGGDEGGTEEPADGGGDEGGEEAALVADPADCVDYDGTQGVTDDTILVGNSLPQSGLFSVFDEVRKGMQAYFDYVNENGGVDGRQLELISLDDQYEPSRTRANAQRLVEEEGVFAFLGMVGTTNNQEVQEYLAEQGLCVPNLATATGSPLWGQPDNDPWTIGGLPSYAVESAVFVEYLKETNPDAQVAVLFQNDDFGKPYVDAFKKAIEGTDITIVGEESFDPQAQPDTQAQVTTLAATGADTALLAVTSIPCPNTLNAMADAGWEPLTYISITCTANVLMGIAGENAEGVVSTRATYDPSDPATQDQESVQFFRTEGANQGLSPEDIDSLNVATGWGYGDFFVKVLEEAGEVERAAVMNAAWNLSGLQYGQLLEGVSYTTDGVDDPFGLEQLEVITREGGTWVPQGELYDFEGRSSEFTG